jgi:hypothetical protein
MKNISKAVKANPKLGETSVRTFLSEATQFGPLLPFSFLFGHSVFPKQRTGGEIKSQDEKEKFVNN